jgi:hypothetical protein
MNNKGQLGAILIVFVMFIVLVGIVVVYYFASLALPPIASSIQTTTDAMEQASADSDIPAMTNITQTTFGNVNDAVQNMRWFTYAMFIFMFVGFLMSAVFVRAHPVMIIVWIGFVLTLILVSIYMASSYNSIRNGSDYLASSYQSWTTNDYILQYLPIIVTVMGFVGGIFLFVLVSTDSNVGGFG